MVKLTIHSIGIGQCSLSGKEGDILNVTFEDGTTKESNLSFKSLQQLLKLKLGTQKSPPKPTIPAVTPATPSIPVAAASAIPVGNGTK